MERTISNKETQHLAQIHGRLTFGPRREPRKWYNILRQVICLQAVFQLYSMGSIGWATTRAQEQVGGVIINAMETLGTKGKAVVSGLHLECKSDDTDLRLSPLIVPALKAAYLPGGTNLTNPNNSTLNSSKSSTNEDSILELITPNQITHIGQPKAHISTDTSPPLSSQSSTPDNPNDSLCRQASDGGGGWICADRQPGSRFKS